MQAGTRHVLMALATGVVLTIIGFLLFGNSPTVIENINVPSGAVQLNSPARTAPVVKPPASVQSPVRTTLDTCELASPSHAYTVKGTVVSLTRTDGSVAGDYSTCSLTSGYDYSVLIAVQNGASYNDYQSSMSDDNNSVQPEIASSGPAVPIQPLTLTTTAAYSVTGTYTGDEPFYNITMLVDSVSGATYLVTVYVAEDSPSIPALNANELATTVALNLP